MNMAHASAVNRKNSQIFNAFSPWNAEAMVFLRGADGMI
jgi:hypothetical protein